MKRAISNEKPNVRNFGDKIAVERKIKAIFKFRIDAMNPFNNARLALKVTFKADVNEPEIRIENDHFVSFLGVERYELIKDRSSKYIESYYSVHLDVSWDGKLNISTIDPDNRIYVGMPEILK
jgi:hypothetical protein